MAVRLRKAKALRYGCTALSVESNDRLVWYEPVALITHLSEVQGRRLYERL